MTDLQPIISRARRGELAAWHALLSRAIPVTSPGVAREFRDAALRDTYAWLSDAIAPTSHRRVVVAIGEAAKLLAAGRRLRVGSAPFHTLSAAELERLAAEVREALIWCGQFPQLRQLYSILRPVDGVQSPPLEIAHANGRLSTKVSRNGS